jgi:two-component system, LytTR family, response regulator LytT
MNILIVEDEEPAALRLKKLLTEIEPDVKILEILVSVRSAVKWLKSNQPPELILMDINLADGLSFEIFSQVEIDVPIIFITAFDEYAIRAFKVNSIEYLLKPVKKDDLVSALGKYKRLHAEKSDIPDLKMLIETLKEKQDPYKKRFLIRYGEHIKTIDINQVAYFYTEEKINFLKTKDDRTYPVEYNLDKLETMLDPERFFRINRQFIISIDSIVDMFSYSKSRVKVNLNPPIKMDTIVSTERSPHFKEWLSGKE